MTGLFDVDPDAEPNYECRECGARYVIPHTHGAPTGCPACHADYEGVLRHLHGGTVGTPVGGR